MSASISKHQQLPEEASSVDLRALISSIAAQRWVLLAVAAVVTTAVVFWTLRQPKVYAAMVVLEYDPTPPRPLGSDVEDVSQPLANFWLTREFYDTQNQIISSRSLAERVVRKLSLHQDADFLSVPESDRDEFDGVVVEQAADVLRRRIRVEPEKDTRLVHVLVEDRNPERAALLANTLADSYVEKTVEDRLGVTVSALEWLSTQLDSLKDQLDESELALHEFKRDHDVLSVSLEDRQNIIANDIQRYSQALADARTQQVALRARLRVLEQANSEDPMSVHAAFVNQDQAVMALREQFRTKSTERDALAVRYGPAHPSMVALDQELDSIRNRMRNAINGLIEAAQNDLREANGTESGLRQLLEERHQAGLELNLQAIEYSRLQRQTENNSKLHQLVLQRTAETDLTRMLQVAYVRIVDRAVQPNLPIKPRTSLNIAIGILAGLLLGVAVAFLRTRLDRRVRTAEDVENMGVTVLGVVPAISESSGSNTPGYGGRRRRKGSRTPSTANKDLIVHNFPMSSVAESCRTIRTNLTFMAAGKPLTSFVVTSPGPQDGKTTVAVSLAVTMAQSGLRTLIVDTDLRRPRVHKVFGVSSSVGVTSILVGGTSLEEAVQPTDVPDLFVLPSGPVPPNPSELLHSEGFHQLIQRANVVFDRVIFDSPPIGVVTDPAVIAPQVAGALLILKPDKTDRDNLAGAIRQLSDVRANLIGAVLNDVDMSRRGSGYYYYYYGRDGSYSSLDSDGNDDPSGGSSDGESGPAPRATARQTEWLGHRTERNGNRP